MSQEKVDKYKQEKANRKKTMAKEKLKKKLYILLGAVITAAFVAWIGWSVYTEKKAAAEQESMIASLQAQLATATVSTTTGTAGTTGTDDATTADTTTSADEKESSEETTEEETTTSADEKSE
ncbi:MAG: hypothetical protein IIW92_10335 [Lachnospiraceae bacterium]|nr:hypothetical protein [Lachnospiraceae bacterium]